MITIIDYGAGNLFSVQNALNFLGVEIIYQVRSRILFRRIS